MTSEVLEPGRVAAFEAAVEQHHQAQEVQETIVPLQQPVPPAPRMPRIVEWLDVGEYPGFRAKCWINPPRRLAAEINSGDEARVRAVLKEIVVEHNGWADDTGAPLPPAGDDAFWDELGGHLMTCLMSAIAQRAAEPPLATRRSRS